MAYGGLNVHLAGTGRFLPSGILTNNDLAGMVDTSDEWIAAHTGIHRRHVAGGMSTLDMAERAALAALGDSGLSAVDIGMVIASTVTADRRLPSLACDLQKRLGVGGAICFDINVSCTGFIYAVDLAARYLATGTVSNALVVAGEKLSGIVDYSDRSTCVLFGDGAGAVVLSASTSPGGLLGSYLAAAGDGGAALRCRWDGFIEMDGHEVFKFAVRAMPLAIEKVLAMSGHVVSDITHLIPHQANIRIIEAVTRRHDIPPEKVTITIDRHGNTSSASIPIALDELNREGRLKPGDLVMMVGFGAGLTYGATVFEIGYKR